MDTLQDFVPVSPYELKDNFFDAVDNGWMLITAGDEQKFNTMTASAYYGICQLHRFLSDPNATPSNLLSNTATTPLAFLMKNGARHSTFAGQNRAESSISQRKQDWYRQPPGMV